MALNLRAQVLAAALLAVEFSPLHSQARPDLDSTALGAAPAPFIGLSVADLDRAIGWYRDVLGFRLISQGTVADGTARAALLQNGASLLEVLDFPDSKSPKDVAPQLREGHMQGFFKAGFVVANLDSAYSRLRQRGARIDFGIVRPANGLYRTFGLRDPEGNLIQLFGR